MTEIDARDRIILEHAPLVAVPRYTNLAPLEKTGHRYLVAQDGVWLEICRPWLNLTELVSDSAIALPYGNVTNPGHTFAFEDDEISLLVAEFIVDARKALPNECAAWGVWNERTQMLEYRPCIAIAAGVASVEFHRPRLDAHEQLAIDIHSHGALPAGFSPTDNKDDAGEVKLAIVVGELDGDAPTVRMRLCAMGLFLDFAEHAE